jgi:predicted GIY-YIG superfamily endonuclease
MILWFAIPGVNHGLVSQVRTGGLCDVVVTGWCYSGRTMPYVYVIHLERPMGGKSHYTGFTQDRHTLENRIRSHRSGTGAKMLADANGLGIRWRVVRLFRVLAFKDEKRVKRYAKFLCPICQFEHMIKAVLPGDFEHTQLAAD